MRILFDSKLSQFKTPFGTLQENETCTFHILIPCSCRTTAAALVLQAENGQELRRVPLTKQSDKITVEPGSLRNASRCSLRSYRREKLREIPLPLQGSCRQR